VPQRPWIAATLHVLRNRYVGLLLQYGIGFGLLAWIIWNSWDVRQDGQQVGLSVVLERPLHFGSLVIGFVLCTFAVFLTFVRWFLLVRAQDLPFTFRDAMRLGLVGYYFNTFLPGAVGGDLVKAAFLAREQSRRTVAIATLVLDRVLGFAGLFWLATLLGGGLYLSGEFDPMLHDAKVRWTFQALLLISCGVSVATLVLWIVLGWFSSAWLDRIEARLRGFRFMGPTLAELMRAVRVYRQKGGYVAAALGMSLVSHFCFVVTFYCGARFFSPADELPPFGAHLLLLPIGMTIQAGVPLPGGMGVAEIGFGGLYRLAGFPFANGVLGSLGRRIIEWTLGFVGYLAYLRMRRTTLTVPMDVTPSADVHGQPATLDMAARS
jgi:uncharacterized protein (TIRG00374 family)